MEPEVRRELERYDQDDRLDSGNFGRVLAFAERFCSSELFMAKLREKLDALPVMLSLDPTRRVGPEGYVGDAIAASGQIRNMHETGITGGVDMNQFGREEVWFDVTGIAAADLPKYAAIHWSPESFNPNSDYGRAAIVINAAALADRMSISAFDSLEVRGSQNGAATYLNPFKALVKNGGAWEAIFLPSLRDVGATDQQIESGLGDILKTVRGMSTYAEVHIWGRLPIDRAHLKEVRFENALGFNREDTATHQGQNNALANYVESRGIPLLFPNRQEDFVAVFDNVKLRLEAFRRQWNPGDSVEFSLGGASAMKAGRISHRVTYQDNQVEIYVPADDKSYPVFYTEIKRRLPPIPHRPIDFVVGDRIETKEEYPKSGIVTGIDGTAVHYSLILSPYEVGKQCVQDCDSLKRSAYNDIFHTFRPGDTIQYGSLAGAGTMVVDRIVGNSVYARSPGHDNNSDVIDPRYYKVVSHAPPPTDSDPLARVKDGYVGGPIRPGDVVLLDGMEVLVVDVNRYGYFVQGADGVTGPAIRESLKKRGERQWFYEQDGKVFPVGNHSDNDWELVQVGRI